MNNKTNTLGVEKVNEKLQEICLIKIGSNSIVNDDLEVDIEFLKRLKQDIEDYEKNTGEKVIILSSGAVALGKQEVKDKKKDIKDYTKSQLASIGQDKLILLYKKVFDEKIVSQILFNDELNENRFLGKVGKRWKRSLLLDSFKELLNLVKHNSEKHIVQLLADNVRNGVLNILNYNDSLSSIELNNLGNKSDNDANVVYLSKIINKYTKEVGMKVSKIIFITNTRGVLDENKDTVAGESIKLIGKSKKQKQEIINEIIKKYKKYIINKESTNGTGGMFSKIKNALETLLIDGVEEVYISYSKDGLKCLADKKNATYFKSS